MAPPPFTETFIADYLPIFAVAELTILELDFWQMELVDVADDGTEVERVKRQVVVVGFSILSII